METKTCSKCRITKPLSEFQSDSTKRDGHHNMCKACKNAIRRDYARTKEGMLKTIYKDQHYSSKKRGHQPPKYTLQEFIAWALPQKELDILYKQWVESGYYHRLRPTFDRADDSKGYSFGNFNKWMTRYDNGLKGVRDHANDPKAHPIKPVIGVNLKTHIQMWFPSLTLAAKTLHINKGNLWLALNNSNRTAGGFKWEYANKKELVAQ